MDWAITLPVRSREAPITDLGFLAPALDDENETAIVRQLALTAMLDGHQTVGDLIDDLARLSPTERRAVLDKARTDVGLEPTGVIEQRRADFLFDAEFQRLEPPPPPRWSPLQSCHAPDCRAFPTNEGGALREVTVERWFCPRHRVLAQPGDLEEHEPPIIGVTGTMAPIYSAKERRRRAEWAEQHDEKQERERRRRKEHDEAVAAATEAARERYRDEGEISILGVRCRPDGRFIR